MQQNLADISFIEHPSFSKKIKKFNKKYDSGIGFKSLKKLLEQHFHPQNSQIKLTPQVLRRINRIGANIEVYKVIMRVKNLRSGQSPRLCFRHVGNLIVFLCFGTHINNYKDNELKELVKKRIKELDPEIEFSF
ncbi:hypothetical protein KKA02_00285 [Patescibacteria group bacterium]|nr:hypothetical protein [Patescibacteria group bacterium]